MQVDYDIIAQNDIHPGGGLSEGHIDQDVVLDRNHRPLIRSSHLKGLLRESALEILLLLRPELTCAWGRNCDKGPNCLICTLFGREGQEGALLTFTSARPHPSQETEFVQVTHVCIDPATGTARQGGLFSARHVGRGSKFHATIGMGSVPQDLHGVTQALLRLALLNIKRLGGLRRRGKGRVKIKIPAYNQDQTRQDIQQIKALDTSG